MAPRIHPMAAPVLNFSSSQARWKMSSPSVRVAPLGPPPVMTMMKSVPPLRAPIAAPMSWIRMRNLIRGSVM